MCNYDIGVAKVEFFVVLIKLSHIDEINSEEHTSIGVFKNQ